MQNCSFPNTEHRNSRSICILSFPRNSGRPLLIPVNSLGAPSKHGLMETFNKDGDVTNGDKLVSPGEDPWHRAQSVKVCWMKKSSIVWPRNNMHSVYGSRICPGYTCFPSTLSLPSWGCPKTISIPKREIQSRGCISFAWLVPISPPSVTSCPNIYDVTRYPCWEYSAFDLLYFSYSNPSFPQWLVHLSKF